MLQITLITLSLCHHHHHHAIILLPGVRLELMPWSQAAILVKDGSLRALAQLGRLPSQQKKYRKFRSEVILATYASTTDYLYSTLFDVKCQLNDGECLEI